jgi:hypothetical protein
MQMQFPALTIITNCEWIPRPVEYYFNTSNTRKSLNKQDQTTPKPERPGHAKSAVPRLKRGHKNTTYLPDNLM